MPLRQFLARYPGPTILYYGQQIVPPRHFPVPVSNFGAPPPPEWPRPGPECRQSQPAGEKFRHRNLICCIEHSGCGSPASKRAPGKAQSGKPRKIGLFEGQGRRTREIEARRRADEAPRPSQAIAQSVCACRGCRAERSCEPSQNSTKLCTIDCGWTSTSIWSGTKLKKMMRFNDFEPLVHQGCRIDRDLRPHRPVGMLEGLLDGRTPDGFRACRSERTAGGGQDDTTNIFSTASAHGLEKRIVLGIDRKDSGAGRRRAPHEQGAGADQRFLVRKRDDCASLRGGKRRFEAGRAGDRCQSPSQRAVAQPRSRRFRRRRPRSLFLKARL